MAKKLECLTRGHIFSRVQPFYERAVSNLGRSIYRSLWVYVAHSSFIEGLLKTKNTASGLNLIKHFMSEISGCL